MINFEVCNLFIGHVVTRRSKHFPFGDQLQFWPLLICQPKLRRCRCKISFPPSNFSILSHTTPSRTYFDRPNLRLPPIVDSCLSLDQIITWKTIGWDENVRIQTKGGNLKILIFLRLTLHFFWHFYTEADTVRRSTTTFQVNRSKRAMPPTEELDSWWGDTTLTRGNSLSFLWTGKYVMMA